MLIWRSRLKPNNKTLILQFKQPKALSSNRSKSTRLSLVKFYVTVLRALNFKFTTVSKAMSLKYGRYCCLTFDCSHRDLYHQVYPWLAQKNIPATLLIATSDIENTASNRPSLQHTSTPTRMTWKNIKSLSQAKWEIGTVGNTDKLLIEKSFQEQMQTIQTAKNLIVQRVGKEPQVYAYPKGAYDSSSINCLKACGFRFGLSLTRGINRGEKNHFHLKRLSINSLDFKALFSTLKYVFIKSTYKNKLAKLKPSKSGSHEVVAGAKL